MSLFEDIGSHEGFEDKIYPDHAGIPTIGVGYNLQNSDILKTVLEQFGYSEVTLPDDFDKLVEDLIAIFENKWTQSNKSSKTNEVNKKLEEYKKLMSEADQLVAQDKFEFKDKDAVDTEGYGSTKDEMEPIFDEAIEDFEDKIVKQIDAKLTDVDATKAQEIWDGLAQSQQNTLLSLTFNGGAGIIGTNLSAALRDKNWADAYYEIVYGSNKQKDFDGDKKIDGRSYGLQIRRIAEGAQFIDGISTDDKQKLYNKLKDNKATIEKYLDTVVDLPSSGGYKELSNVRHTKLFSDLNSLMDNLRSTLEAEEITVADVNFKTSKIIHSPGLNDVDEPARVDPVSPADPEPVDPPEGEGPIDPPTDPDPTDPTEPSTPPADPIVSIKETRKDGYTLIEVYFNDDSGTSKILAAVSDSSPEGIHESAYFIGFPHSNDHIASVLRNSDGTVTYRFVDKKGNEATDLRMDADKTTLNLDHPLKGVDGEWVGWEDAIKKKDFPLPPPPPKPDPIPGSPLILDLDGDGVETVGFSKNIYFDHDGNGFKELTGFSGVDDGLLVFDKNGNGSIENGRELFGNSTILKTGLNAKNGFEALAEFDSNNDRIVDQRDVDFSKLQIWRDFNLNGLSDSNELLSLADAGVTSLNLSFSTSTMTDVNGNQHLQIGHYTNREGEVRALHDVWFNRNTTLTVEHELVVPEDIKSLPDVKGYGNTHSLHQVMVRDTTGVVKGLVGDFVQATNHQERLQVVEKIIFSMSGQAGEYGSYYQAPIDVRRIRAMEAYYGYSFGLPQGTGIQYAEMFNEYFDQLISTVFYQLSAGSHLNVLFSIVDWTVNPETGGYEGDFSLLPEILMGYIEAAPESAQDFMLDVVRAIRGVNPYDRTDKNFFLFAYEWEEYISTMVDSDDAYGPIPLGDLIYPIVSEIDDSLIGTNYSNTLIGYAGNDLLEGKKGDDVLYGGVGNDVYRFMSSDGLDVIRDQGRKSDFDVVELKESLSSDVKLFRQELDLIIIREKDFHEIRIKNYFLNGNGDVDPFNAIELISFKDNSSWDVTRIKQELLKYTTDDDVIAGYDSSDVLIGGKGDDTLYGHGGDDTYIFSLGDGSDKILDRQGLNVIKFTAGIDKSQLLFERWNNSLLIKLTSGDSITLEGIYENGSSGIHLFEGVIFADETKLALKEINAQLLLPNSKNQDIRGYDSDDYIAGGENSNTLIGGDGNDTYFYALGDGNDIIRDSSGIDVLIFG